MRISKFIAGFVAVSVLALSALTSCGASASTPAQNAEDTAPSYDEPLSPESARAYVKAYLDATCLGEYDRNVPLAGTAEGEGSSFKEDSINAAMDSLSDEQGLNDEVREEFRQALSAAFSSCKYTVGEASEAEDGGYDVKVTIEPLKLLSGANARMEEDLAAMSLEQEITEESENELNNRIFSAMAETIRENAKNPTYDQAQEVTVHYGLLNPENGVYGLSEEDAALLGSYLFSTEMD